MHWGVEDRDPNQEKAAMRRFVPAVMLCVTLVTLTTFGLSCSGIGDGDDQSAGQESGRTAGEGDGDHGGADAGGGLPDGSCGGEADGGGGCPGCQPDAGGCPGCQPDAGGCPDCPPPSDGGPCPWCGDGGAPDAGWDPTDAGVPFPDAGYSDAGF
jgi:hypothetical protein